MTLAGYVAIGISLVLFGAQLKLRSVLIRFPRTIFILAILLIGGILSYEATALFKAWITAAPPLRYLAPPFTSLNYFFLTIFRRFYFAYLASLIVAMSVLGIIKLIPRLRREKLFEREEPIILALALFLVGHPLWIMYLATCLLSLTISSGIRLILKKKPERISLYYFWLPLAIIIILLGPWIYTIVPIAPLRLSA